MSDLTDRMRTCAAYILTLSQEGDPWAIDMVAADAADLLIEASNALEAIPEPLGEPMAIIEPPPKPAPADQNTIGQWYGPGDILPVRPPSPRPNRVCPNCDSRAAKRVYREGNRMYRACPICAHAWAYQP